MGRRMTMMKNILILTLCMGCLSPMYAQTDTAPQTAVQQPVRFGYLSYDKVLHSMPGYQQAQHRIDELRAAYQNELSRSEEQFSKAYAEYVDGQQTFPENILLKRQKELQTLMEQAMQFKKEARELLEENEKSVMSPLYEKLNEAIQQVGMKQGYAFIVNTDQNAYPFINGSIGTDVSADVLNHLK